MTSEAALAQYAVTGTFNNTYYLNAVTQIDQVLDLCQKCTPQFIGKVAVYARTQGFMKDMPAFLCAHLTTRGTEGQVVLHQIFNQVIDNGKMLRNFVQVIRSGITGRKSMGSELDSEP
jgi:60 kDa SS-A/Ro ribonucleoprotein